MTLPPDNHDDDIMNAIGDVDPMKWLESLAARQGADPEEFVTMADLDVPEADPNAVVDGPGYVAYGSDSGASSQQAAPPPPPPPPTTQPEPVAAEPSKTSGEIDPMAWLESLARRQGADPEEFVTDADLEIEEIDPANAVIDEPGYTPYGQSPAPAKAQQAAAQPAAPPPPPPPPPEPVPAAMSDPILFDDFEENELSASQAAALLGMDTEELAPVLDLAADMTEPDIPVPPPSEVVTEPEVPTPSASIDPMGGEVDPLAWLESLAKRQGVRHEELITRADVDVPEAAADAIVDGPGYEDYSPFGTMARTEEVEEALASELPMDSILAGPVIEETTPSADDTLAWLENLAEKQAEQGPLDLPVDEPVRAAEVGGDPLAGMSDEEIELRAAAGDLTAAQMEAWLNRQAASLVQTRMDAPAPIPDEELPPAEPAEMPAWLQEAMPEAGMPTEEPALVDEIIEPPQPEGLDEEELSAIAAELPEPGAGDTWVRALDHEYITQNLDPDEIPDWYQDALDPNRVAELEERLTTSQQLEITPVDEELVEEEPEEAIAEPELGQLPDWLVDAAPDEALPADIPDWLTEQVDEAEAPVEIVSEEIDNWLLAEAEVEADVPDLADELAPAEMPDWLSEVPAEEAELPDWLTEAAPDEPLPEPEPVAAVEPEPEPEPAPAPAAEPVPVVEPEPVQVVAPAPAAAPTPAAAPIPVAPPVVVSAEVPAGAAYDNFRQALSQNPDDHATRLSLARQLSTEKKIGESLGQYETLIFANTMLNELAGDLTALVQSNPTVPQARRVLGDVLMRQGRLQDALKLYRSALEQL